MMKYIFILLGTLSLGIGITGIFIPGLPTTPFLLLTAGLYVRSSDKLYSRLIHMKYVGAYISEFRRNKGMAKDTKIYSISMMWAMVLISVFLFIDSIFIKSIVIVSGVTGTIVMGYLIPTFSEKNNNK